MPTTNKFRIICAKIVGHPYFDNFILFLILFSTILLTLETPLDPPLGHPAGKNAFVLNKIDVVVTILFTWELVIKVIVYGFAINGPDSYIRNAWN